MAAVSDDKGEATPEHPRVVIIGGGFGGLYAAKALSDRKNHHTFRPCRITWWPGSRPVKWSVVHVFVLIGFRNRVTVMGQWVWAYVTRVGSSPLITEYQTNPGTVRPRR